MAVAPWESYQQSCAVMNSLADLMANNERPLLDSVTNSATRSSTFTNQLAGFPTIFIFVSTNSSGDDGTVLVSYSFGKKSSDLDTNLTQAQQWSKDLATIRTGVEKYNTAEYATLYSIGYFTVLISANVALCFLATVLSRIILREICASARVVSTLSLLISNFFSTFFVSSFFLIALLGFSIPVSWLLLPLFPIIAKQSLLTFILVVYGASFGIWAINYVPLNVIIVITFLPSIFAIFATFISFVLIIGRNFLHKFVSSVLLRCAEKSPITVIGACFALLIAIVTALTQLMRGSF